VKTISDQGAENLVLSFARTCGKKTAKDNSAEGEKKNDLGWKWHSGHEKRRVGNHRVRSGKKKKIISTIQKNRKSEERPGRSGTW